MSSRNSLTIENKMKAGGIRSTAQAAEVISPAPRDAWREIYRADPDALVTQSPEWLDSLCSDGKYEDASRLYVLGDGQRILLPVVRRRYLSGAVAGLSSFPDSWGMGGLLSTQPVRLEEMRAIYADLLSQKDVHLKIRPNPLKTDLWEASLPDGAFTIPRVAHVLDLSGGFSDLWENRFKGTARTAVRKAEKSGLVVECDTSGRLIPVFYELFNRSLERWSEKQHEPKVLTRLRGHWRDPLSKFQTIARHLGQACKVWVAWLDGRPAASILVLQGANASYTRGAMDKTLAGPARANDLLHRLAIENACEAGCHYYHMGETGQSRSLAAFKSNFGAVAVPYSEIYYERLPVTRLDGMLRGLAKKVIGFRDA